MAIPLSFTTLTRVKTLHGMLNTVGWTKSWACALQRTIAGNRFSLCLSTLCQGGGSNCGPRTSRDLSSWTPRTRCPGPAGPLCFTDGMLLVVNMTKSCIEEYTVASTRIERVGGCIAFVESTYCLCIGV